MMIFPMRAILTAVIYVIGKLIDPDEDRFGLFLVSISADGLVASLVYVVFGEWPPGE